MGATVAALAGKPENRSFRTKKPGLVNRVFCTGMVGDHFQ